MTMTETTRPPTRDLRKERPFETDGRWRWRRSNQTKPFLPNRLYVDEEAGVVVLVCLKSKNGNDYAVSADALEDLPARVADPASWVQEAHVMLVDGDFEWPDRIDVAQVMTVQEAADFVRGSTPLNGRSGLGRYFWLQADDDGRPM